MFITIDEQYFERSQLAKVHVFHIFSNMQTAGYSLQIQYAISFSWSTSILTIACSLVLAARCGSNGSCGVTLLAADWPTCRRGVRTRRCLFPTRSPFPLSFSGEKSHDRRVRPHAGRRRPFPTPSRSRTAGGFFLTPAAGCVLTQAGGTRSPFPHPLSFSGEKSHGILPAPRPAADPLHRMRILEEGTIPEHWEEGSDGRCRPSLDSSPPSTPRDLLCRRCSDLGGSPGQGFGCMIFWRVY